MPDKLTLRARQLEEQPSCYGQIDHAGECPGFSRCDALLQAFSFADVVDAEIGSRQVSDSEYNRNFFLSHFPDSSGNIRSIFAFSFLQRQLLRRCVWLELERRPRAFLLHPAKVLVIQAVQPECSDGHRHRKA